MNKTLKIILLSLFLTASVVLTSCGKGSREINTIGIVVAVGFDLDGEDVVITNEVINPTGASATKESGAQETTTYVVSRGKTVDEAILNASLTFDRTLYYPHAHLIILGEEVVKEGVSQYIDILSRNDQIRETTIVMVAKDAKAYEIMGINSGLSNSPGRYIYNITTQSILTGKQRVLDINRFLKYYYRAGGGYVLGIVEEIEKKTVSKDDKGSGIMTKNEGDTSKGNTSDIIKVLSMEGGAVFKDAKLKGYFTGEEMMAFNFLVDEFKEGTISFEAPKSIIEGIKTDTDKEKYYSSFRVFKNKTKKSIKLEGDKLHLYIDLKLRGSLKDDMGGVDLDNPLTIKKIEKAIGEDIKNNISKTLKKGQKEFETDAFGILDLVHRKYPELWRDIEEDWDELFKDLDYTIRVDANINDVGFINTTEKDGKSMYEK